jgi:hypothetical protein
VNYRPAVPKLEDGPLGPFEVTPADLSQSRLARVPLIGVWLTLAGYVDEFVRAGSRRGAEMLVRHAKMALVGLLAVSFASRSEGRPFDTIPTGIRPPLAAVRCLAGECGVRFHVRYRGTWGSGVPLPNGNGNARIQLSLLVVADMDFTQITGRFRCRPNINSPCILRTARLGNANFQFSDDPRHFPIYNLDADLSSPDGSVSCHLMAAAATGFVFVSAFGGQFRCTDGTGAVVDFGNFFAERRLG